MNIIKHIFKTFVKFISIRKFSKEEKVDYAKRQSIRSKSTFSETKINPATGLPMVGCLDLNGSSYGTSNSFNDYHRNHEPYRSISCTSFSAYNSFNNHY